jgi:type I restriction enzyme S subunit
MSKYRRYARYKDSGVEWIGEIPKEWEIANLGYKSKMIVPMRDKPTEFSGDIPWIRIEDVDDKYIEDSKSGQRVSIELVKEMNLKVYPIGTVLCTCSCNMGTTVIVKRPVVSNQTFIGIVPNNKLLDSTFLYYAMNSNSGRLQYLGEGAIQQYLSKHDFEHLKLVFPTINEQKAIANFLDQKTAEIDGLIADKGKLIELLQGKRQAIIGEAVTKGLNQNVRMKDSRIKWIGEIPEHWEVTKIKYAFYNLDYMRIPLSSEERGLMGNKVYDYYGASGVIDTVDDYIFDDTLILIGEDGANLYSRSTPLAYLATGKFWVNNHAHILKPKKGNINYFVNLLESIDYTIYISGSAQPKLTQERLGSISIPIPPGSEQNLIGDYLVVETLKIDTLITNISTQIQKLKEYRQSLISEAVTGKIDVRDYVVG